MPKLMTGYTGVNIFAADDQALYKGIIGESNVVFNVGGCLGLDVTAADNSVTATISSGAFSFNGRIVRLQNAKILSLTGIVNDKYRRCKVVARYSVATDFKESVKLVALCSSDVSDTAAGAADLTISGLNETSTINGSTTADFPLWDFVYSVNGLSGSAVQLFTVTDSLEALRTRLNEVEKGLSDEVKARGTTVDALDTRLTSAETTLVTTTENADAARVNELHGRNGDGFDIVSGCRIIVLYWKETGLGGAPTATAVVPNRNGAYHVIFARYQGLNSSSVYTTAFVHVNGLRLTTSTDKIVNIVCIG